MSKDKTKQPESMDPSIRENKTGVIHINHQRNAKALVQLVDEVRGLFPETPYEFSNYNGRNTALDVTFDLTALAAEEAGELAALLSLVRVDPRVAEVVEDEGQVLVGLRPNARTQDITASFGLAEAWDILVGRSEVWDGGGAAYFGDGSVQDGGGA